MKNITYFNGLKYTVYFLVGLATAFVLSIPFTRAEDTPTDVTGEAVVEEAASEVIEPVADEVIDEVQSTDEGASFVPEYAVSVPTPETVIEEEVIEEELIPLLEEPVSPTEIVEPVVVEEELVDDVVEPTPETLDPAQAPVLSTDKDDYQPGETVTLFGRFFSPVKNFFVHIFGNSEVGNFWSDTTHEVTSDEDGSWSLSQTLDNFYRPIYNVIVSDEDGEVVVESSFKDAAGAAVTVFDQCANDDGDGYNANPGDCAWTNGNMNTNNSTIYEEDSTVQRLVIDGLSNGEHVVTLEYQTTKGGKHAYDFLTDFNQSETWVNRAKLCAGDATTAFPLCTTAASSTSGDIPHDPLNTNGNDDTNQNITILNGTISTISTPIKVSGTYGADSLTQVNVTFSVNTANCLNKDTKGNVDTCPVLMAWGAHVSSQADWGVGQSALDISGSPYHMKVVALDGASTGNRDNQMQADAILPPQEVGTIVIEKQTLPDGDSQSFTFNPSWSDQNFNLSDGQSTTSGHLPGTYSIVENVPSGWLQTSAVCTSSIGDNETIGNIELDDAETVTCVFTNTKLGALTLVKSTVGGNGSFDFDATGTGLPTDVDLTTVGGTASQTFTNLDPANTYTVAENVPTGWILNSATCDNSETIDSINIDPGQTVTCTFVNSKLPTLTLVKTVVNDNGGTKTKTDFQGKIDGNNVPWDVAQTLPAGSYTASETNVAGYTASAWGTDCNVNGGVTLSYGENKTCSITNNDTAPILHLRKVVVNDNGGSATAADFTLTANGTGSNDLSGTTPVDSGSGLLADTWVLSETNVSGYSASDWVCVGGTQNGASITLGVGQEATCTITNDDQQSYLILNKTVVNDNGGTAVANDFDLEVDDVNVLDEALTPVNPGSHTASETNLPGYTAGVWGGDCGADGSVNVPLGTTKTCTITNDDQAGELKIVKNTLGGDGSFDFTVMGPTPSAPNIVTVANTGTTGFVSVNAGAYSVAETVPAGWDLTSAVCTSGTPENFTVPNGGSVTCTFTNTKRGSVTIVKDAINNNAQDFTFNNNFGNGHPATFKLDDDSNETLPNTRTFEVITGTYAVTEDAVAGWQQESATCDLGETIDSIDVGPGENVTCTFVNEQYAKIILVKNAVGGNGDFDFDASGDGLPADIDLTTVAGTASQTFENLDQDNTYSITENVPAGWDLTSAVCSGTNSPASITPNPGETVTCTFTNTKRGHIIVDKVTYPAASSQSFNFTAGGTGYANFSLTDAAAPNNQEVKPGKYSVAETLPAGWAQTSATCDSDETIADLDVEPGETVTCTFTNVMPDAKITLDPLEDVNEVDDDHVFTATVEVDSGAGFVDAPDGTLVSFSFVTNTAGAVFDGPDTCLTTSGSCTVTINSSSAGIVELHAGTDVTPLGVALHRETDGTGGNSGDAEKTYVDASIALTPQTGTNEVDDEHEIVATITKDEGSGPVPAEGETVTFTVTTGTAQFVGGTNTCETDSNGKCSIFIVDDAAGQNTINASVSVTVLGLELVRATDGDAGPDGSDEAAKTYVDARIKIGDSAKNNVGDPHTFTVLVEENDGDGWDPAEGETVDFTLLNNLAGASFTGDDSCVTDVNGECTVEINSATPGTVDIHAVSDVDVLSLTLHRETDGTGENSDNATKTYVAGKIRVVKETNPAGSTESFEFDPSWTTNFSLIDGEDETSEWLPLVGGYSVTELAEEGWDLISATCDNGDEPDSITLDTDGELVICTFTNRERGSLTVTKVVDLGEYTQPVNTSFDITVTGPSYPGGTVLTFTVVNGVVSGPQTLDNLIPGVYEVTEDDGANVAWTVTGEGNVTVDPGEDEEAVVTNTIKQPNTTISVTADTYETAPGGNVILTITDTNDGEVPLANNTVEITYGATTLVLDMNSPEFVSGDTNGNDLMDPGETWKWVITLTINANTTITVEGHGEDPLGNDVSPDTGYDSELGTVDIRVIGTTRTIGFWQTHTVFTSYVFENYGAPWFVGVNQAPGSGIHKGTITNALLPEQSQLFGGFYAPIAKTTTGGKRTPVDQARIQMLQQLLAAKLNCAAFGCSASIQTLIANADAAYAAGASKGTIISLAGQLDVFNNSGDAFAIPAGLPPTGKATPKDSKNYAKLDFWNNP